MPMNINNNLKEGIPVYAFVIKSVPPILVLIASALQIIKPDVDVFLCVLYVICALALFDLFVLECRVEDRHLKTAFIYYFLMAVLVLIARYGLMHKNRPGVVDGLDLPRSAECRTLGEGGCRIALYVSWKT